MNLFYRKIGKGQPLIILHGLWGASENWLPVAKKLENNFEIYLPDLRNHGFSFHHSQHDYLALANDVRDFIKELNLSVRPHIIGHSMGGKTVMTLLQQSPEFINKSIIVDMAPITYSLDNFHLKIAAFLYNNPLENYNSRKEIHQLIEKEFKSNIEKQLLLKNIRKKENGFSWKVNIQAIKNNLNALLSWDNSLGSYDKNILFIKGEKSPYIANLEQLKSCFPYASLQTIPDTTHYVHAEKPEELAILINNYLHFKPTLK